MYFEGSQESFRECCRGENECSTSFLPRATSPPTDAGRQNLSHPLPFLWFCNSFGCKTLCTFIASATFNSFSFEWLGCPSCYMLLRFIAHSEFKGAHKKADQIERSRSIGHKQLLDKQGVETSSDSSYFASSSLTIKE